MTTPRDDIAGLSEEPGRVDRALSLQLLKERDALQARVKELEQSKSAAIAFLKATARRFAGARKCALDRATRLQQERDEAYERAEDTIRSWTNYSKMQLHAGEMTAQEKRTTEAILNAVARQVRRLAGPDKIAAANDGEDSAPAGTEG